MSIISTGAVYSRAPLTNAALVEIDEILAGRAERLTQTRKGKVWNYIVGDVVLDVEVQDVDRVLFDREDDLLALGLLQEAGHYRVVFTARTCSAAADDEIGQLCTEVASAIGGISAGAGRSS